MEELDQMKDDTYKDSTLILQLLRDNMQVSCWQEGSNLVCHIFICDMHSRIISLHTSNGLKSCVYHNRFSSITILDKCLTFHYLPELFFPLSTNLSVPNGSLYVALHIDFATGYLTH